MSTHDVAGHRVTPSGYATCGACGQPLTEQEHFVGDLCEVCERDFLHEGEEFDDYPRAA